MKRWRRSITENGTLSTDRYAGFPVQLRQPMALAEHSGAEAVHASKLAGEVALVGESRGDGDLAEAA